jgi:hypothetical protein
MTARDRRAQVRDEHDHVSQRRHEQTLTPPLRSPAGLTLPDVAGPSRRGRQRTKTPGQIFREECLSPEPCAPDQTTPDQE